MITTQAYPLAAQALRDGASLADLQAKYHLAVRRHREHSNLVLLKYDQIESPMREALVQDARGIVLDEADGWRPVCWPFSKFFNHGEQLAAPIDWATAEVFEKLDGSLCSLYWYGDRWQVATTGTPDASGNVNGLGFTFRDLFLEVMSLHGDPPKLWRGLTVMFELTSPWNRVVVRYPAKAITMLGARDNKTGREIDAMALSRDVAPPIPFARSFPLRSFAEAIATFEHLRPLETEGYVIRDASFNHVKVKHPGYVALHHLKDGMSPRRVVELVQMGEGDEVVASFPEWAPMFDHAKRELDYLISELEATHARIEGAGTQKEYALEAVKTRCSGALFALRAKRTTSIREFLCRDFAADKLMTILGLRESAAVAEAA